MSETVECMFKMDWISAPHCFSSFVLLFISRFWWLVFDLLSVENHKICREPLSILPHTVKLHNLHQSTIHFSFSFLIESRIIFYLPFCSLILILSLEHQLLYPRTSFRRKNWFRMDYSIYSSVERRALLFLYITFV